MTKEEKKQRRNEKRKAKNEAGKGFFNEFKKFIMRGNVVDMAVGVIIGSAFSKIVTTLTNQIIMPWVTWVIGDNAVSDIKTVLRPEISDTEGLVTQTEIAIMWGELIQTVIDFLLIAFVIFLTVKIINSIRLSLNKAKQEMFNRKKDVEISEELVEEAKEPEPVAPTTEELLTQIVEILKAKEDN